jgi:hypothetical protein
MFTDLRLTGVWLADSPLDCNEGTKGDQVLQVDLPDSVNLDDFELVEKFSTYREWCVPAAVINTHAAVTLIEGPYKITRPYAERPVKSRISAVDTADLSDNRVADLGQAPDQSVVPDHLQNQPADHHHLPNPYRQDENQRCCHVVHPVRSCFRY